MFVELVHALSEASSYITDEGVKAAKCVVNDLLPRSSGSGSGGGGGGGGEAWCFASGFQDAGYRDTICQIGTALMHLHTFSERACPVALVTRCTQEFVTNELVVQLLDCNAPKDAVVLFSAKQRKLFPSRAALVEFVIAKDGRVPTLVQWFFQDRTDAVGRVADELCISRGVVDPVRVAEVGSAPYVFAPVSGHPAVEIAVVIARAVVPVPVPVPVPLPPGFSPSLLAILRRVCDGACGLGVDGRSAPLIVVASGGVGPDNWHMMDQVLQEFVDLGILAGSVVTVRLMNSADQTIRGEEESRLASAVVRGVPVVLRTAAGVPAFLTQSAHLRLMVAHLPSTAMPCLSLKEWKTGLFAATVWSAIQDVPVTQASSAVFADPKWRPVPPCMDPFQEDVQLLAEMLYDGRGLRVDRGGKALLREVATVYAAYRRTRGYFKPCAFELGVTLAMLQASVVTVWPTSCPESFVSFVDMQPGGVFVTGLACIGADGCATAVVDVDASATTEPDSALKSAVVRPFGLSL